MSYLQVLLNKSLNEIYQNNNHQSYKEETLLTLQELFTSYPYFHYTAAIMSEQDIKDIANVDDKKILLPYFNRVITTSDIKYKVFNSRSATYPFRYYKCLSNFYYLLLNSSNYNHPTKSIFVSLNDFFKKDGYVNEIYKNQIEFNKEKKSYFHRRDIEFHFLVKRIIKDGDFQNNKHKILNIFQKTFHENLEILIMELYAIKQLKLTAEINNHITSNLKLGDQEIIKYDIDIEKHQNALIDNLFNEYLYKTFNECFFNNEFKILNDDDTEVLDEMTGRTIEVLDYYEVKTTVVKDHHRKCNEFIMKIRDMITTFNQHIM